MTDQDQKKANSNPTKGRSGTLIASLSILIAIIAIVFAGFTYQQLQATKTGANRLTKSAQLAQQNLEQRLNALQTEVSQQQVKNETNLNQLLKQTSNMPAQQALSQAKYLIHLASLNLKYRGDIYTAKEQLLLALTQINQFHTPEIESLKEQINQDLQTLTTTQITPPDAILNQLDQLIDQVKQIPILPTTNQQLQHPSTSNKKNWWGKVKDNMGKLKSLIVIQHIDNPNAYAFTPEQKILAKQLTLVKLTQAEWAVINRNQSIYEQSLKDAQKLLTTMNLPKETVNPLNQVLTKLQKISLTTNTTSLTSSQKEQPHSVKKTAPTEGVR